MDKDTDLKKLPKPGAIIKVKDAGSQNVWYVQVDGYYDILESHGGGKGMTYHGLTGGMGECSTPLTGIEKIKEFKDIKEAQADIDSHNQLKF